MFAAALNIVLNLFLIPKYSYIGASISTVSTELFSFFFLLYCVTREGYRLPKNMLFNFFRIIIACSAMALFIRLFSSIDTLPLIFMASVVYLVAMLLTGVMDNVDIQMARQLIGGAKSHGGRKGT
jgi:O-antigen/teichoic acid export membrane protein